ncbi:MAG: ATP-binding protein [Eubacteriales bacterium]|nr:ATP-binding protein [Eubacteriales bacterium]
MKEKLGFLQTDRQTDRGKSAHVPGGGENDMGRINPELLSNDQAIKKFLRDYIDKPKDSHTLNSMLRDIGSYYDADRAYIFEYDWIKYITSNTYEWCADGITSEINNLQNISLEGFEVWSGELIEKGEFFITSLSEDYAPGTRTYQILEPQGIESLMAAAIMENGRVAGFLGVDNPREHTDNLLLLSVAGSTCYSEITSERRTDEKVRKTNEAFVNHSKFVRSMSEIYSVAYVINLSTGWYVELDAIDGVGNVIPNMGDSRIIFSKVCREYIKPEFSSEMQDFFKLYSLNERMAGKKIISKRYLSTFPREGYDENEGIWTEAAFIDGGRDEEGNLTHVVFTVRIVHDEMIKDIEQRKALEKANREYAILLREEKQHTAVIGALANIFMSIDYVDLENKTIRKVLSQAMKVHRGTEVMPAEETFELILKHCIADEHKDLMRAFFDVTTIGDRLGDERIISEIFKDLRGKWNRCSIIPVKRDENGKNISVLLATRNVNADIMKELEKQEELEAALRAAESASRAKTNFLFNMSHDIRTPMNAIMGYRNLLERHQDEPEKRQDYLNKIKGAEEVLLSIINNVLEMTRIEQADLRADEVVGSTEQYIDGLRSMFREMMNEKNIEFITEVNVEHKFIYCDIGKVRDIFVNLISNAWKYTNPGGRIHYRIDELPTEKEGVVYYRTTVYDNGIGMSEEFIPHIFEAFSRENSTTDSKVEGTGLGMPIVKQLVDILGGTIDITSKKGVGTSVIVTIPHRIASEEECLTEIDREIDAEIFKGKHILLAEDNELNAEIAIEILKDTGIIVDRAVDGQDCLEIIQKAPAGYYDLVLMDIQMPRMTGYEASVAIRKLPDKEKAGIPIVAVTANAFEEDKKEAFRCGMNGHIAKPIIVRDVLNELAKIFG